MAFNTKNTRLAPPNGSTDGSTGDSNSGISEIETIKHSNVVATQSWVGHVLDRIWNWTHKFRTGEIQVTGPLQAESIHATEIRANEIVANKLTLLDDNGKPVTLYVDEYGELKTQKTFEGVFIYPGNGEIEVRSLWWHDDIPYAD